MRDFLALPLCLPLHCFDLFWSAPLTRLPEDQMATRHLDFQQMAENVVVVDLWSTSPLPPPSLWSTSLLPSLSLWSTSSPPSLSLWSTCPLLPPHSRSLSLEGSWQGVKSLMVAVKKLLWRGLTRGRASYNLGVDSRMVCGVWMMRMTDKPHNLYKPTWPLT